MHEALLLLLDHSDSALLEAACGVLINLAADPPHAAALLSCGGGEARSWVRVRVRVRVRV